MPARMSSANQCCGIPMSALVASRMSRMLSISMSADTKASSRGNGRFATSPPETTTSRTRRGAAQVVDHRVQPVGRLEHELVLVDLGGGVADQVHPGAVPAVLRAGRHDLGEHFGGVAMGESLDGPHLRLVQRVPRRVRVARPVGTTVAEDRQHVVPNRVGVERLGVRARRQGRGRSDRVEHLRRQQHRHRGPLGHVALQVGVQPLLEQVAHDRAQLLDVLHAVRPLPLHVAPLRLGHVPPAGQPGPVRLDQLGAAVGIRLLGGRRQPSGRRRRGQRDDAHLPRVREIIRQSDHSTVGFPDLR